jgi:hypothetical protein
MVFGLGYGWHGELGTTIAMQAESWTSIDFFNMGKQAEDEKPIPLRDISLGLFHTLFVPRNEKNCFYAVGRSTVWL